MKYGYTVKFNGEYYPAGANVPDDKAEEKKPSALFSDDTAEVKRKPGRPAKVRD